MPKGSERIVADSGPAASRSDEGMAGARSALEAGDAAAAARWVVPSGWRELNEARPMRVATFVIEDEAGPIEVAVTRFAGDTGGPLANVNRWRGQMGLDPVTAADLDTLLTPFSTPGFEGYLLHLHSPTQHMLAASIHEPGANRTWFVRVVAEQAAAERVKSEVFAFARSFGTAEPVSDAQEQE